MRNILIADDSGTARMFIRKCFDIACRRQVRFIEAGDGDEALRLLKKYEADLIVTDLTMPNMGGVDLLKHVQASPKLHSIPVMVITSAGNEAKEKELLDLGARTVMAKPISPAMIAAAMETIFTEGEEQ